MRKYILLITAAISINGFAQAPDVWSLEKCIEHALQNNISIKQGALQSEILNNNLSQSKLNRLPTLNASANQNYNTGRSIDPFTNTFDNQTIQSNSFSFTSGITLFAGNRINNTIKMNQVSLDANNAGIEVSQNQISNAVVFAYLQIIMAEENLKTVTSQRDLTKEQLERAKKLVEAGSANISATLNLEAQIANDELQIVNAENLIQMSYNSMINLLQLDLSEDFRIATISISNIPVTSTETPAELYQLALANMPEIRQSELNINQAQLNAKVAKSGYYPSLSAYANVNTVYSESGLQLDKSNYRVVPIGFVNSTMEEVSTISPLYVESPFSDQLTNNLGQSFGLSLQVPIFNGYRTKTSVENAIISTQIASFNNELVKNQLRSDITTAYTNMKAAKAQFDAASLSEIAQSKNFEFNQKRFDAGLLNSVDLLYAKNMWFQSQIQLITAKYDYIFRAMIIEFYKGNELKLTN